MDHTVRSFPLEDVQTRVSDTCGQPWAEIREDFEEYWGQFGFSGLVPGCLPLNEPTAAMESAHLSARIWDAANAYLFEIRGMTDTLNGVILMKYSTSSQIEPYRSQLSRCPIRWRSLRYPIFRQ